MPSFKPKATKKIKIFNTYMATLDSTHQDHISYFLQTENETIPLLKQEKQQLIERLGDNTLCVDDRMDILDRLRDIKISIKSMLSEKNNYYLDNSNYIFEYFENKQQINNEDDKSSNESDKILTSKNQIVRDIFKVNQPISSDKITDTDVPTSPIKIISHNIVRKYMTNIDESLLDMGNFIKDTDVCSSCYRGEMVPMEDEGVLICDRCSVHIPYLIENEKPSYKEPPKEVCFYAYKKINHFKEILSQFQGKETTQIPDNIIESIKQQIIKERITLEQLSYTKTKEILKKLGFNKYYEHIAFIKNKLGISPPIFSQGLEEILCNLFVEIQAPYARRCPDYRVNFLNYYYVLFKFCELLNETEYLSDIPRLKDREKLIDQDDTWRLICYDKDWEFIATV